MAAMEVLTQRALLRHIGSFMGGLPFVVGEFVVRSLAELPQGCETDPVSEYPKLRGLIPQLAILRGEFEMLGRLLRLSKMPEHEDNEQLKFYEVVRCAVVVGKFEALEWLSEHLDMRTYEFESSLPTLCVFHDVKEEIVGWLEKNAPKQLVRLRPWVICQAVSRGNLAAVKWFHSHGYDGFNTAAMDTAAGAGRLDVLEFLHNERREGCTAFAMDAAASNGHLDCVRFLHENRTEGCTRVAMGSAAVFGHVHVVNFLAENRSEGPHDSALEEAAACGQLEGVHALVRLSTRGCIFQARKRAAKNKHTLVVEFLTGKLADKVWNCNTKRHEPHGPRRCERQQEVALAIMPTVQATKNVWVRVFSFRWLGASRRARRLALQREQ